MYYITHDIDTDMTDDGKQRVPPAIQLSDIALKTLEKIWEHLLTEEGKPPTGLTILSPEDQKKFNREFEQALERNPDEEHADEPYYTRGGDKLDRLCWEFERHIPKKKPVPIPEIEDIPNLLPKLKARQALSFTQETCCFALGSTEQQAKAELFKEWESSPLDTDTISNEELSKRLSNSHYYRSVIGRFRRILSA